MIEVRRIISTYRREAFAGLWQVGKGSSPKGAEAESLPGQTENICLAVTAGGVLSLRMDFSRGNVSPVGDTPCVWIADARYASVFLFVWNGNRRK